MIGYYFAYILLVIPFVVVPFLPEQFLTAKVLMLLFGIDLVLLASLVRWFRNAQKYKVISWWKNPFIAIALAYVGWMSLSSLFGSSGVESLWGTQLRSNGLWIVLHSVLLALALSYVVQTKEQWMRLMGFSVAVALLAVILGYIGTYIVELPYYFGSKIGPNDIIDNRVPFEDNLNGVFGNAAFFAGYILLHIVFLFIVAVQKKRNLLSDFVVLLGMVVLVGGLLLTQSRAAGLALVVGLGSVSVVYGYRALSKRLKLLRSKGGWISFVLLVVVIGFVGLQFAPVESVPRALRIDTQSGTAQARLALWGISLDGMKANPLLGWGRSGGSYVYTQFYRPELQEIYGDTIFTTQAHNAFLAIGVESGFIGLLLFALLFGVMAWYALSRSGWGDDQLLWYAVFGGVVGYATYLFFSIEQPAVQVFFWILFGWMIWSWQRAYVPVAKKDDKDEVVDHVSAHYVWPVAALIGVLLLVVGNGLFTRTLVSHAFTDIDYTNNQWFSYGEGVERTLAQPSLGVRCELWSEYARDWVEDRKVQGGITPVVQQLGDLLIEYGEECTHEYTNVYRTFLLAQLFTVRADRGGTQQDMRDALSLYQKLKTITPDHMPIMYGYAHAYILSGNSDAAVRLLEEKRDAYPEIADTYWFLGLAYSIEGQEELATQSKIEAKERGSRFAQSYEE